MINIDYSINGETKLLGVIGNPIEHSISPVLHNTISRYFGLNLTYVPLKVEASALEYAIKGLRALNFLGFNVTVPYKTDVIKFLDDTSKEAIMMGAVNTIKNIDGRLFGYNTDAEGFSRSFKDESGSGFAGKTVVMIGAGGAARAMAVRIALEGAKKIYIMNRTVSSAENIAGIINNNIGQVAECLGMDDKKAAELFYRGDIIVNTTSVGMHPDVTSSPVGSGFVFRPGQVVFDAVYNPPVTRFLRGAAENGCKTVNGLGMLFYQGIFAYEIWTGLKLKDELVKEVYSEFVKIL